MLKGMDGDRVAERTSAAGTTAAGTTEEPTLTVYWRPGCFFCGRLLRGLERAGVTAELRNIWADDAARDFVRRHNRGNETVPTVALGAMVWTNPDAQTVTRALRAVGIGARGV